MATTDTFVLGLSITNHDSSATLLRNGAVIYALNEERFTRVKNQRGFPKKSVSIILREAKIAWENIERLAISEPIHSNPDSRSKEFIDIETTFHRGVYELLATISYNKFPLNNIDFHNHYLSHAASTFFPSNFRSASVLCLDAAGQGLSGATYIGENNSLTLLRTWTLNESIGIFYSAFTAFLGFKVNEGEYKLMGLSAYGKPKYTDLIRETFVTGKGFLLSTDYYNLNLSDVDATAAKRMYTDKFIERFGQPFEKKSSQRFDPNTPTDESLQYMADIASSVQTIAEEEIIARAKDLVELTGNTNLCLAGGVALNCLANQKICKLSNINLFVQPNAGDAGASLGAAYLSHQKASENKNKQMTPCPRTENQRFSYGIEYPLKEIQDSLKTILNSRSFTSNVHERTQFIKILARILADNKVVGFFEGQSEWGPRALGNRSIIASPALNEMKERLNSSVKFREPYRPFAPVIIDVFAKDYFDVDLDPNLHYSLYSTMTVTAYANERALASAPASVHFDGTSRIQVLRRSNNELLYDIIYEFFKITGIPLLINTSFNLNGEPNVESPSDAAITFSYSGIEVLAMFPYIIERL